MAVSREPSMKRHGVRWLAGWQSGATPVLTRVAERFRMALDSYRANPLLVTEHANIELATAEGGYGRRQVYELVQNGADALVKRDGGRISVVLTDTALYCANEGEPVDAEGVDSLLASHISEKRGTEIGRFGLGFKSVLGVSRSPDFFSRSGSFSFDAGKSSEVLSKIASNEAHFPVLRLAWPLDAMREAANDSVLDELMSWATTVVRLRSDLSEAEWLAQELNEFPAEFLLFSPHVGSLVLEDKRRNMCRDIGQSKDGAELVLTEPGSTARWRVFSTKYRPSSQALSDAGELARREEVPLVWAVPGSGRLGRGRFWAFFPTEYETTLSGIVNAPWKTNEDRQNLLRGSFNDELLERVATLVVESIPDLVKDGDPAWFLDVLPARGREAPSWADERITEEIYRQAASNAALPDLNGELRLPAEVRLNPEGLSRATAEVWASYPDRPADWCHPSVNTRERYPRAMRLLEAAGQAPEDLRAWLEALVHDGSSDASIAALRTASRVLNEIPRNAASDIHSANIVLSEDNTLASADGRQIFLPSDYEVQGAGITFVHGDVVRDSDARAALTLLGIGPVDVAGEITASFVRKELARWNDQDWESFWLLARHADPSEAPGLIVKAMVESGLSGSRQLRVRTVAGPFRPIQDCLLPGPVVPADGSRDAEVTVDTGFHIGELELLKWLGAVDAPVVATGRPADPWFSDYEKAAVERYFGNLSGTDRRPQRSLVRVNGSECIRPLTLLGRLSDTGNVELTGAALGAIGAAGRWSVYHETRCEEYPQLSVANPALWRLRSAGWLNTSLGPRPVSKSIAPALADWSLVLPVADISADGASLLRLPSSVEDVPQDFWETAVERASGLDDDALLGRLYGTVASFLSRPDVIRCRVGSSYSSVAVHDVTVVEDHRQWRALIEAGTPVLLAQDRDARSALVGKWQLRPAERAVSVRPQYVPVGPETLLTEEFPALGWLRNNGAWEYSLVRCASLILETATATARRSEEVTFCVEGQKCLALETLTPTILLETVDRYFDLGLSAAEIEEIIENREKAQQAALAVEIRSCDDDAERVAVAIGAEALRAGMPSALVDAVSQLSDEALDDRMLGRLALAIYGVSVLKEFRDAQEERGLLPPTTWAGSSRAVQYVRELGFPREYAGWEQARRPAHQMVDGPAELPQMHHYQRSIADGVKELISRPSHRRGVLALPTGSGKTRIAVQALVEAVDEGTLAGPLLWVAQSDELCEQAVQAWTEVWRSEGPQHQLMISRLWATNEAAQFTDGTQVVIATIDKLRGCISGPGYDWLKRTECLVIDEAHSSTQPSYTRLLDWLGLGRGRGDERCALLGLTGTPYRGTSEEETKRLVARYGGTRLDRDTMGEVTYADLQNMEVLARVDHRLIPGVSITLTVRELDALQRTRLLPPTALSKVGADLDRNLALLESIRSLPDDWPILLFAASVDHARTMAALLASQGISAGAVSAETESDARRHYIDKFRRGDLRVLTNYQVLTQGFDAPSVRALYIARPTYSPNLYQQMIGRGLRGPLNGGKPRCLIVNVEDNFAQYGEKLAFTEFEYLWSGP